MPNSKSKDSSSSTVLPRCAVTPDLLPTVDTGSNARNTIESWLSVEGVVDGVHGLPCPSLRPTEWWLSAVMVMESKAI